MREYTYILKRQDTDHRFYLLCVISKHLHFGSNTPDYVFVGDILFENTIICYLQMYGNEISSTKTQAIPTLVALFLIF